ncbi:MAG: MFS transporter [Gilvibacter sp.]
MKNSRWILPVIVISQFCCTSLWFASNGVMTDLISAFDLPTNVLGDLTSAVQFGFIAGTLVFAILTIADRFSPSKVFLVSALLGAIFNAAVIWDGNSLTTILLLRFLTGFFLAGIYPVGMKIAADYFKKGLGKSLGYLVGALVLGTALPHLLKNLFAGYSFTGVLLAVSILAVFGGVLMAVLVPDGPYRKPSQKLNFSAFFKVFKNKEFRAAAFGYFGHMWELYAFWAFVPVMLATFNKTTSSVACNVPLWSFLIIAIGGIACILGGYLSLRLGAKKTARTALLLSGLCCLISPFLLQTDSALVLKTFLLFWGMVVIADSPMFSTLVAQNADPQIKGTALTIVNCVGFAITIISIQILSYLSGFIKPHYLFLILGLGPLFGLLSPRIFRA